MLTLTEISKTYEGKPLLTGVTFSVDSGETVCLLGASGSGKSTLLRIIAGLEPPEAGRVLWDGIDLAPTPPHARDFGLVFQDYALFPHLTVFDNVAFGLRMRNLPKVEIQNRVAESLETVTMRGFESRRVTELSGGEQQRVALARALATRPRLLMFDEPLGALDRSLKEDLLNELRSILRHTNIPAIYVTHDQEEAFALADRVLLLHEGTIVREGSPAQVWNDPQSAWTARFLNVGNVIEGRALNAKRLTFNVETNIGVFELQCKHQHADGDVVALLLKPSASGTRIKARVEDVLFNREQFKVTLRGGLVVQLDESPKVGSEISVMFRAECLGTA
jgi:spermidine/putrescine transport system ATP-binding protein